jgi:hypothetical protein
MAQTVARWTTEKGRRLLAQMLRNELRVQDIERQRKVADWEWAFVHQTMRRLARRHRRRATARQVGYAARTLAQELDLFGGVEGADENLIERLEDDRFKGDRAHFVRLIAHLGWSEGWDRWRKRTRAIPDLRGANLGDLDLRHIDLSGARLRGANLSAAVIRTGTLTGADLRDCNLRHTDLSYADLQGARLSRAILTHTLLTDANLKGADLRGAFLVGTSMNQADLGSADLRGAIVWGINTWNVKSDEAKQKGLYVVPLLEPLDFSTDPGHRRPDPGVSIRVDDLEVAHFVSMLSENPKIGRVINAAARKVVLLLGRFVGSEREVLRALRDRLPSLGYVPVVFDFDEPEDRDTIETVAILAGLSSFVVANLSKPRSTPLESHLVIPAIAVPFVPIIRAGERPFAMFTALQRKYPWVLPVVTYRDEKHLLKVLRQRIVAPAERMANRMRALKHPGPARRTQGRERR